MRAGGALPRSTGGGESRNWLERSRKKKLIVAFHFQYANQAGWKCDECRKTGLERKRKCQWQADGTLKPGAVVWARKQVSVTACPRSLITAASEVWLYEYHVRRRLGGIRVDELAAKDAEAFLLLDELQAGERNDG